MNVLVVGSGGREFAIVKKIRENKKVDNLYVLPGNAGMDGMATCVPIGAKDLDAIVEFAKTHPVDFAVVAPDDPLVLGLVDRLEEQGIPCFGPRANAAILEGSKVFSKGLMKQYGIPTAAYEVYDNPSDALEYAGRAPYPLVIKADGLALGKGVVIAKDYAEAQAAIHSMMEDHVFGKSGDRIVMEEFLTGPEVSVLSFTDGKTIVPMVSSMDHKRALDNDEGLNTGGMGTVAPNPYYTPQVAQECMERIFLPTIRAMSREGRPFKGCLYFGLMLTPDGPKVIEYNCRFGDPETQVVLPLLDTDLLEIMMAVREERLDRMDIRWKNESACCVILASDGYPGPYKTGYPIRTESGISSDVIYAGVKRGEDGMLITSGGRVLGVVRTAPTLDEAIQGAYEDVKKVHFENAYCRHDIGKRALLAGRG